MEVLKMRAIIYARYSSENQQEASIEDQVRNAKKLVADRGWILEKIYADRAISGATTLRPGYQRLLADAAARQFDVVVTEGLDRLSRDAEAMAGFYKRMNFYGISILTRSEGDITDLHVGFKGVMNAVALRDLGIKTHRGIEGRVRQGRSGGGRAFGYRVVNERDADGEPVRGLRRIDPIEAEVVRRIFREFVAGKSPRAIATELNANQIASPGGKGWRDTTIRGHATRRTGILPNDLYAGRLLWNKQTYVRDPESGKRLARVREAKDHISIDVPEMRIVERDLWNAVQARLDCSKTRWSSIESQRRSVASMTPSPRAYGPRACSKNFWTLKSAKGIYEMFARPR